MDQTRPQAVMRLASGKYINLFDFKPEDVYLSDVIVSLEGIVRCNGHYNRRPPLNVLQHSLLVSHLAEYREESAAVQLAALMHDAHEAYIGDTTTPCKVFLGVVEPDRIILAVRKALRVEFNSGVYHRVKAHDIAALDIERRSMWGSDPHPEFWPTPEYEIGNELASSMFREMAVKTNIAFRSRYHRLITTVYDNLLGEK